MEMYGNEIKVQQGEDWNIDFLLSSSSKEYIPYIVCSKRKNPQFVVTIASAKYERNERYVKSWWNDILRSHNERPIVPTFYQTTPFYAGEYGSIDELPDIPKDNVLETYDTRMLYQYTLSTEEIDDELGHKPYHYFYFDYIESEGQMVPNGRVDGYECRLIFNFSSDETSKWGSQEYFYQIMLVSGELIEEYLDKIAFEHDAKDWPSGLKEKYLYVKREWPDELQPDIDEGCPLGYIENPVVIVPPTKLRVFNNLRRLI